MPWRPAPLKTSFLAAGMLGFIISIFWITKFSINYGIAFAVVFALMIVASFISMVKASPEEQLYAKPRRVK